MFRKKKSKNQYHVSDFEICLVVSSCTPRDRMVHMSSIMIVYLRVLYKEICWLTKTKNSLTILFLLYISPCMILSLRIWSRRYTIIILICVNRKDTIVYDATRLLTNIYRLQIVRPERISQWLFHFKTPNRVNKI